MKLISRHFAQAAALVLFWPVHAAAQAPVLQVPVQCALQDVCWVVQYFDHEAGPLAKDYLGGARSYDSHTGTDIGLVNYAAMADGIPVVAAAGGIVGGARDGMPDSGHRTLDREAVEGRECGNGVRVDHGGGWQTLYCHLLQGSVAVGNGEEVTAGQVLGFVGQSGLAAFPHLGFTVFFEADRVDPFLLEDGSSLWSAEAAGRLAYAPVDIYHLGFADAAPEWAAVQAGDHGASEMSVTADALVVWAEMFSVLEGDVVRIRLSDPEGVVLLDHAEPVERTRARFFRFIGTQRPGDAWPPGTYQADVSVIREGEGGQISRERSVSVTLQ